ncbi:unnamed protein product [Meganyctiphanes norvegica]|uniref:WAP domain-containing protein n=1 Tax=Meganyctiphanes norvegica TaxID=48144 RepID=A0AAV2SFI0_MEGNR
MISLVLLWLYAAASVSANLNQESSTTSVLETKADLAQEITTELTHETSTISPQGRPIKPSTQLNGGGINSCAKALNKIAAYKPKSTSSSFGSSFGSPWRPSGPFGGRPYGGRPYGGRPYGGRPYGGRPNGPDRFGDYQYGEGPYRPDKYDYYSYGESSFRTDKNGNNPCGGKNGNNPCGGKYGNNPCGGKYGNNPYGGKHGNNPYGGKYGGTTNRPGHARGGNKPVVTEAPDKPGSCPTVKASCPPSSNFDPPPQVCSSDRDCDGVDKCCFNKYLNMQNCTCITPIMKEKKKNKISTLPPQPPPGLA